MNFLNFTNFKNLAHRAFRHPIITGSSVMFIGSFLANIFNYLFNLSMGRMLPVEQYGLLISLSSLFILFTIFTIAFTKIFAKFSARYAVKEENEKVSYLISKGFKYIFVISLLLLIILLATIPILSSFLHVENNILLIIIFTSVLLSLIYSLPGGVLQGYMRFHMFSFINILQSLTKFIAGLILVYLGFGIFGAVGAILISAVITVLVGYLVIAKHIKNNKKLTKEINGFKNEFSHYTYTFILTSIGITLLSNTDIILVRHLFEETVSGQYAALSLMGKAIFYLMVPINFVFFPLIAQKREKNERLFNTVLLTSGIVISASIALSFVYFAFPGLVLSVFFPSPEYQMLKPYLGFFSLYILMFSMVNLFNSFFLSIGKTGVYKLTLAAGVLQIGFIYIFHNSLYQVIGVLFAVNFLLFISFLLYYMRHGKD